MSQTWSGPASSHKEPGPRKFAATQQFASVLHSTGADEGGAPEVSASELLRQLSRDVMGCGHVLGADERLRSASVRAAKLITAGQLNRTAAATVLSVSAQATGIGQADALAAIREAFHSAGVL